MNPFQAAQDPNSEIPVQGPGDETWTDAVLHLRKGLKFDVRQQSQSDGRSAIVVEDVIRSRFFQIGEEEYSFISRIDGKRSVQEILLELENDPAQTVSESRIKSVCNWLSQNNFLLSGGDAVEQRLLASHAARESMKLMSWLNPICFKIKLGNPNRILSRLTPALSWVFSFPCVLIWLLVGSWAVFLLAQDWERFTAASIGVFSPSRWLWLLIAWVLLKVVHEMGHGICCKKYGGEVREAGALFLLFAPLAYVDVTSSWRFASRWQRICVSSAGMYIELAVAFAAAIVWSHSQEGMVSDVCYNVIVMASLTSILFNANPLMRFDGYYILADSLNVVNLFNRGREWVWRQFDRFVLGCQVPSSQLTGREKLIVGSYGICSACWKVILTITLLIAASVLFSGFGLVLAIVGSITWVLLPVFKQGQRVYRLISEGQTSHRQLIMSSGAAALSLAAMFMIFRAPAVTTAPAITKHKDEQIVRATGDGFLADILVRDGETVEQGQPLVQLYNGELQTQASSLQAERQASVIRSRMLHEQGKLAEYRAELDKIRGVDEQLIEVKDQIQSQTILADRSGTVFARGLENRIDQYFRQGDHLMSIGNFQSKVVSVSMAEEDFDYIKSTLDQPVRISFPGMPIMETKFDSIKPRASDRLTDQALAATAGGPLAVKPGNSESDDSSMVLLQPRFIGELSLDDSIAEKLPAGQRGHAFIRIRSESLGRYLFTKTRKWFADQIQQATQMAEMQKK